MSRRDEQLLFRYSSALERGDFETVAEVLRDAERDPVLEQMILDLNAAYTAEPSLNHKNPKEVPMIAALYQKPPRPSVRVQWQSLPLVAALAVIGLLVVMLAVQTRLSNISSGGQGSTPLAVAQNNSICQATSLAPVNVLSLPSTSNGVVVGTILSGVTVNVLDQSYFTNPQGAVEELWYFIVGSGVQGWTSPTVLNTSNCPVNQLVQPAISSSQQAQTATSQAALLATATQIVANATTSAEYPTFTPTPVPLNSGDVVEFPPQSVVQRAALCTTTLRADTDVLSLPSSDGVILGSLPANTPVAVMDTQVFTDAQNTSVLWYFIAAKDVQGWVSTRMLETPGCPQTQAVSTFTPTPAPAIIAAVDQPVTVIPQLSSDDQHNSELATRLAQSADRVCKATTYNSAALASIPSWNGAVLRLFPANTVVSVGDYVRSSDSQGQTEIWYFVVAEGNPGWMLASVLDTSNCPYISPSAIATPVPASIDAGTVATIMPPVPAQVQALSTFTPTPVPFASNSAQQATLSCNSSIGAHVLPFTLYAQPGYDASVVSETTGLLDPHWITWLQTTVHAQSIWYQVQYADPQLGTPQTGWVTEEQFNTEVLCALISRGEQPTLPPPPTDATPVPASQQSADIPAAKCPTPSSIAQITMYSRPSLDSFNFSQNYDAAQDAFFLLDSTDVDGQPWYFVRIGSSVDAMQGWITWDDYNLLKDCAPFNTSTQASAVPSDGTIPMVPTVVPSVASALAVPTIIPADVPSVPSDSGFLLDTCHFDLSNTVALYAQPSNDAQVTDLVHVGTSVEVSMPALLWYWVTVRYPDGMGNTGFVRADALTLPADCHLTPPGTASVIPADVAPVPNASLEAVPTVPTALAVPAMPIYTHYVVQPGDTLLYILSRFNLDSSALPKVLFINDLSQIPTLSAGMTLLIPTPTNAQPLTCIVNTRQTLELRASPSADDPVLMTLPTGTVFQIGDRTQESGETWYSVTAQINQVTISNVWLQSGAALDCQRFAPDSLASVAPVDAATGALQPTPTLVR